MNPLPLAAPDGRVYAYACGKCHNVAGGMSSGGLTGPDEVAVEHSLRDATRCCACRRCGVPIKPSFFVDHCPACQPIEQAEREALVARIADREEQDQAATEASLAASTNREAAILLRDAMSDISEEHYCAGWLTGLEFALWEILQGGSHDFGMGTVAERDVAHIRELHEKCGGWWRWVDGDLGGERFVATAKWIAIVTKDGAS